MGGLGEQRETLRFPRLQGGFLAAPSPSSAQSRSSSPFPWRRERDDLFSWEVAPVLSASGHLLADTQVHQTDRQTDTNEKDTLSPYS